MKRTRHNAMFDDDEELREEIQDHDTVTCFKKPRFTVFTSESPSVNMVQQQLESFTFSSPNVISKGSGVFDDMQDEELGSPSTSSSSQRQLERRIYNADLQCELVCNKQPFDGPSSLFDLMDHKMKKRFQMERVEFDHEVGMFQIYVRCIPGITECVTPKTEKLYAHVSESFDQLATRFALVPLQVAVNNQNVVLRGAIQHIQAIYEGNGHFKITIEQWMDADKNKESDTLETAYYKRCVYAPLQQQNNLNLYLQFNQELTLTRHTFDDLARQYLLTNRKDFGGFNLIMHFAARNDVDSTIRLLEIGYDLSEVDTLGYNTLYWAQHFAAIDVLKAIYARETQFSKIPSFPLKIQVDDPSRLQLNEYTWKHFYLSKFNSKCVIRCKQIIPQQQELRIRICNSYDGYIELISSHDEPDKYTLQFTSATYTGDMIVLLYDRALDRVLAESDPITVYDTSSIYLLMCSDISTRKSSKKASNFKGLFFKNAAAKLHTS